MPQGVWRHQVYATQHGSRLAPADNAVPVTEDARVEPGIPHRSTVAAAARDEDRGRR
jgi:hypothetical protein